MKALAAELERKSDNAWWIIACHDCWNASPPGVEQVVLRRGQLVVVRKVAIDGDEMEDRGEGISTSKNASVTSPSASSSLACRVADAAAPELSWAVERREDADMMTITEIRTSELKRKNKDE